MTCVCRAYDVACVRKYIDQLMVGWILGCLAEFTILLRQRACAEPSLSSLRFTLFASSLYLSLPLPRANPCQTVMARRTFFAFFSFSMEKSRLGEGEGERRRNRTAIGSTGCPVTGLRRRILRSRRRVTTPVCVARKQRKY